MTTEQQIQTLKNKIDTLTNDLKNKRDKVSSWQLRAWRKNRTDLKKFLKQFEQSLKNPLPPWTC